jgi:hypothetical protein
MHRAGLNVYFSYKDIVETSVNYFNICLLTVICEPVVYVYAMIFRYLYMVCLCLVDDASWVDWILCCDALLQTRERSGHILHGLRGGHLFQVCYGGP